MPGVGLLTATALVASVGHIHAFRWGRQFASWLGLTPREHSSGTRRRRGAITKQGHQYLRYLLTHGARSVVLAGHRRQRTGTACTPLHQGAVTMDPVRFEWLSGQHVMTPQVGPTSDETDSDTGYPCQPVPVSGPRCSALSIVARNRSGSTPEAGYLAAPKLVAVPPSLS